jgi:hypothetical protein
MNHLLLLPAMSAPTGGDNDFKAGPFIQPANGRVGGTCVIATDVNRFTVLAIDRC